MDRSPHSLRIVLLSAISFSLHYPSHLLSWQPQHLHRWPSDGLASSPSNCSNRVFQPRSASYSCGRIPRPFLIDNYRCSTALVSSNQLPDYYLLPLSLIPSKNSPTPLGLQSLTIPYLLCPHFPPYPIDIPLTIINISSLHIPCPCFFHCNFLWGRGEADLNLACHLCCAWTAEANHELCQEPNFKYNHKTQVDL